MKSRDTNPRVSARDAAAETTPPPVEDEGRGSASGRAQVPISVSDGDFSTPVRRKRTITRPRGLKTLEQEALSPPPQRTKPATPVVPAATSSPARQASVVDEFLAAPPTPEPEVEDETPPPLPPLAPEALRFTEVPVEARAVEPSGPMTPGPVAREQPPAGSPSEEEMPAASAEGAGEGRSRPNGHAAEIATHEPATGDAVDPGVAEQSGPSRVTMTRAGEMVAHAVAPATEPGPAISTASVISAATSDAEASLFATSVPAPSENAGGAVAPTSSADDPNEAGDAPLSDSILSPLAQTLANMAEAMRGDLVTDEEMDIDIADAPLVPAPPQAASVPAVVRGAVPPPPPGGAAGADRRLSVPALVGLPEALAERPRRPKRSKPWYEEVFDESYLRTLPFMTAEQTLREVDFIESSLCVPKGGEVLDVACGYGRHAIELVQRGLVVTGVDLSLPLLIRAADESQRRSVSVNFVHTDMREMVFDRQFAGAYCMLTSFGYFDEESNLKVAEGISRALKPGGRLLLDVINRDYVVGDLPARVWWEGDGCVVLEEVDFNFNTNRILTHRSVVFEDGQQLEQEISLRVYSLHELGKLLRQAGFRVIEVSGSIPTRGHFFGVNSRNLLILAERRAD